MINHLFGKAEVQRQLMPYQLTFLENLIEQEIRLGGAMEYIAI